MPTRTETTSCHTLGHNFVAAKDQSEQVVIFCTKCGEIRPLNLDQKDK
jgi:RNase P subunit RPR2